MRNKINIYVLTTGNEERVKHLNMHLSGIDFEFIQSLKLEELKDLEDEFSSESLKFRKKAIMLGEFGAFSTHSIAWEHISKSNEIGIIIEDSADFIQEASILLSNDIYKQIVNCGLVSFTDYDYKVDRPNDKPVLFDSLKLNKAFPIRCYGMTPKIANVLLSNMKKSGMILPVDKWMSIYNFSGVSGFLSNIGVVVRREGLQSIANKKRGKVSFNPLNLLYRRINKIKYKY